MKAIQTLIHELETNVHDALLLDIYVDGAVLDYQRQRYINALHKFEEAFGAGEISIYSAPGRSEIGGNHTDHQQGQVLAASINNDAIAIVKATDDSLVKVISDGYPLITIDITALDKADCEEGTTCSLIKGVLAGIKNRGYNIGGFSAYITSDVLIGAGLSSSAAFETLIGTIISGLYNNMAISPVEIAIVGQYAENVYFGKPCGLMDQMACSVGSLVHINFADVENPVVERVEFDLHKHGYSLCITDTKGSHANLTPEYAAVPTEMKKVAAYFGKDVLRDITLDDLYNNLQSLREFAGDRAVLRAIHFVEENVRVQHEADALKSDDFIAFLETVKSSGNSSFKYLQNVYTSNDVQHQNVSVALAVSDSFLKNAGACRVHGGGFAGTIQAFVRDDSVSEYTKLMDSVFGQGSCNVLMIRKYGGMKVF